MTIHKIKSTPESTNETLTMSDMAVVPAAEPSLSELFVAYERIEGEMEILAKEIEKLREEKSVAVQTIYERGTELGFGAGPYNRNGRMLTVVKKKLKDTDDKFTYFFKGPRHCAVDV